MKAKVFIFILSLFVSSLLLVDCNEDLNNDNPLGKSEIVDLKYVGDATCFSCHTEQHKSWQNSHHDWSMKTANSESVLGKFANQLILLDGIQYQFQQEGQDYFVIIKEKNENSTRHKIVFTFGFHPLQQYLIEGEKGSYQVLRASWNSFEKKWFHQYEKEVIEKTDWIHWKNGGQRWNTMCAECHSTGVEKNYDLSNHSFNTTFENINIGCESCHGKGSKHIEWTKNGGQNIGIFNPKNQTEIMNQCGPCHSRRLKLSKSSNPWDEFSEHYQIQNLNPLFYELDGQIKEEDYVFGSFLSSKMFAEGVKCDDCHDPHSLKLKQEGNDLCLSCHAPKYNEKQHHQHKIKSTGSECINCHMPGKTYMGIDYRRDHSFRIPRPDQSVKFGTSNACTQCHQNKSNQWAAQKVVEWHGPVRKINASDYLLESTKERLNISEKRNLQEFIVNSSFPEISRATALENLKLQMNEQLYLQLLESINHEEPLVLSSFLNLALNETQETRLYIARKYLFNSNRNVRTLATKLLLDLPPDQLTKEEKNQFSLNEIDLLTSLELNADFPEGRLDLANYYAKTGKLKEAIVHYKSAIQLDPLVPISYSNLAQCYNQLNQNKEAIQTLEKGLHLIQRNDQLLYMMGLLQYENGNTDQAISYLQNALEVNPKSNEIVKNLVLILIQNKQKKQALQILNKVQKQLPDKQEILALRNWFLSQSN